MVFFHDSLSGPKQPRAWAWLLISLFLSTAFYQAPCQQQKVADEKLIERDRLAIDQAKQLNLNNGQLGRLWAKIASEEENLGQMDRAETAYIRALGLLQDDPLLQEDYAVTLADLGTLYAITHREQESLNCRKRSLSIFQKLGDPLQIARGEAHIADAYLILGKHKEAEQHALVASRTLLALPNATGEDRGSALVGYAFASCLSGHCDKGLIAAQQAKAFTRASFPADSFPMGQVYVVLGYTEWQTGDKQKAEADLQEGIRILRHALSPSHPLVVHALNLYRRYLLDTHREIEAKQIAEEEKAPGSDASCKDCKVSVYGLRSE